MMHKHEQFGCHIRATLPSVQLSYAFMDAAHRLQPADALAREIDSMN